MKKITTLLVALMVTASFGMAYAQTAAPAPTPDTTTTDCPAPTDAKPTEVKK